MNNIEIKVNGMVCSGCENRICNVIKDIDGINEVTANHEKNLVYLKNLYLLNNAHNKA